MNKVVIPDAVPFVPNGGQLYYLDDNKEPIPVADEVAKKLIRAGTTIRAPNAGADSYRAVLKRIGFAYAEWDGVAGTGSLNLKVRTGHVLVAPIKPGVHPGVVYTYVAE